MQIIKTRTLSPDQEDRIDRMWDEEYQEKLNGRFRLLLEGVDNYCHHLLLDEAGNVGAWAVEFEKDGEIRFSIIVPAAAQGRGYGKLLVDSIKAGLDEFYGWVVDHDRERKANGEVYHSPMAFYLKQGFEVLHHQRLESDMISAVKIKWTRPAGSQAGGYLDYRFEDTPALVNTFDELPLWSAPFGLLLLKHLELQQGMTVVDVGCGAGFPLLELAERLGSSSRLYGIDTWSNALQRAREKISSYGISNVTLIEGSARQMPFEDNSIDLIVSNLGINNFDDREAVLRECSRVLRTGGRLAITTNLNGHWQAFYDIFKETLNALGAPELTHGLGPHQAHRGTIESVSELLRSAGLENLRHIEDSFEMQFADGSAFMNHHFVKLGWLDSWKALLPEHSRSRIFPALEDALNRYAAQTGSLRLEVPMAFIEGTKP